MSRPWQFERESLDVGERVLACAPMVLAAALFAVLVACLPIFIVVGLRVTSSRPLWQVALDIPFAIALDLILILLLARFAILDVATWLSRAVWVVVAILGFRARKGRLGWPTALDRRTLLGVVAIGLVALGVSLVLSRPCAIWDRQWHIPFVASLRGQRAPFSNVYEPGSELFYHYAGHIAAASLQAYSLSVLHSSHALSLTHDSFFFWTGITSALFLRELGVRRWSLVGIVVLAMLLSGPVTMLWGDGARPWNGYSLTNYLSVSFRPHVSLATLLMFPFVIVPLVRLARPEPPVSALALAGPLLACATVLLFTDEFSLGALGLSMGATWLVEPRILGATRREGLLVLFGLLGAIVLSALFFKGTVGPGTPHHGVEFVAPRSPGFYAPSVAFSAPNGILYFVGDLLPLLVLPVCAAWLLIKLRSQAMLGSFLYYTVLVLVSISLFSTMLYTGSGLQNHRFVTAAMYFGPVLLTSWLVPKFSGGSLGNAASLPAIAGYVALGLGAACTFEWLASGQATSSCHEHQGYRGDGFYSTNCRTLTGARLTTSRTSSTYADQSIWYLYAGCQPLFAPGPLENMDSLDLKVGPPRWGRPALLELEDNPAFGGAGRSIKAVCPRSGGDDLCRRIPSVASCTQEGSVLEACLLDDAARKRLLNRPPG